MLQEVMKWRLTSALSVLPTVVFHDPDTGRDVYYRDGDGDSYVIEETDNPKIFPTEEEALREQRARLEYLKGITADMSDLISEICCLDDNVCTFDRSYIEQIQDNYRYKKMYIDIFSKYKLLKIYVITGMLNINGLSVRKENVNCVKWCSEDHAELIMKDGSTVLTRNEAEYDLVCTVFGFNESQMVFNYIYDDKGNQEK